MSTKLYRSTGDRMIAGVCGGLGAYLQIDPVVVRLFFVLLTLGGGGVLIYLLLWLIIPSDQQGQLASDATSRAGAAEIGQRTRALGSELHASAQNGNPQAAFVIGIAMIGLGLMFLMQNLHVFWMRWLHMGMLWPLLLILAGAALLWRRLKGARS